MPPRIFKFIFQIDQTLEIIHHNLILVLPQGVNKYLQLHQHHYTSHILCHSNSLSQSSSLQEQSLHIFSSTIMFKTGLLLILHLFIEAPWCMLAKNRNKLSSNILCWNIYPFLNGIETTKCFRKNPNWWYWWSSWERGRALNTFIILFTHIVGIWMTF